VVHYRGIKIPPWRCYECRSDLNWDCVLCPVAVCMVEVIVLLKAAGNWGLACGRCEPVLDVCHILMQLCSRNPSRTVAVLAWRAGGRIDWIWTFHCELIACAACYEGEKRSEDWNLLDETYYLSPVAFVLFMKLASGWPWESHGPLLQKGATFHSHVKSVLVTNPPSVNGWSSRRQI
jgi:hypothetical protein